MNNEDQHETKQHMTRADYRQQVRHKRYPFLRRSSRQEPVGADSGTTAQTEANDDGPVGAATQSRADSLALEKETIAEKKSQQLAKKLNIAIAVLVVLIIIVYLILLFIG